MVYKIRKCYSNSNCYGDACRRGLHGIALAKLIGAAGWCYVGYKWKENAMLLNFIPQFIIIIPMLVWIYVISS